MMRHLARPLLALLAAFLPAAPEVRARRQRDKALRGGDSTCLRRRSMNGAAFT